MLVEQTTHILFSTLAKLSYRIALMGKYARKSGAPCPDSDLLDELVVQLVSFHARHERLLTRGKEVFPMQW